MASGNTSKNDGDLSELHRQINQIITDTEVIEEEKKDATLLKKRVDDTEAMVLVRRSQLPASALERTLTALWKARRRRRRRRSCIFLFCTTYILL